MDGKDTTMKNETLVKDNLVIENGRIMFRNFSGQESRFNKAGNRNFAVVIDDLAEAERLANEGWNVRYTKPREEGDEPLAYINVAVSYNNIPPMVVLVTKHGKTIIDEEEVGMLDWAEIINSDLILRPYNWEVSGNRGVKAYLKTGYFTIEEDAFADKYRHVGEPNIDE